MDTESKNLSVKQKVDLCDVIVFVRNNKRIIFNIDDILRRIYYFNNLTRGCKECLKSMGIKNQDINEKSNDNCNIIDVFDSIDFGLDKNTNVWETLELYSKMISEVQSKKNVSISSFPLLDSTSLNFGPLFQLCIYFTGYSISSIPTFKCDISSFIGVIDPLFVSNYLGLVSNTKLLYSLSQNYETNIENNERKETQENMSKLEKISNNVFCAASLNPMCLKLLLDFYLNNDEEKENLSINHMKDFNSNPIDLNLLFSESEYIYSNTIEYIKEIYSNQNPKSILQLFDYIFIMSSFYEPKSIKVWFEYLKEIKYVSLLRRIYFYIHLMSKSGQTFKLISRVKGKEYMLNGFTLSENLISSISVILNENKKNLFRSNFTLNDRDKTLEISVLTLKEEKHVFVPFVSRLKNENYTSVRELYLMKNIKYSIIPPLMIRINLGNNLRLLSNKLKYNNANIDRYSKWYIDNNFSLLGKELSMLF